VSTSRRLLTVLHAAERSGPPLFALQFLRWLREADPTWQFSTLFLDADGPLHEDFAELGPVTLADGRAPYREGRTMLRRMRTWQAGRDLRRELVSHGPIDVAHVHCIGSLKVLPVLPPIPVLAHLHELSVGQDLHLGPRARSHVGEAHRYVAVSDGVRAEFLARFPVHPDLVSRQWGFVDPARLDVPAGRAGLGLPEDAFVVASSGVRHWRKAPEVFVRLAQHARRLAPQVPWHFVWIGGQDNGGLEALVRASDVADIVHFLPHQPDPIRLIAASDVFVLTAREDAFPLVCVEAAAAGRPLVTFANGGAAELVEAARCGAVSPYLDAADMAAKLVDLAMRPDRRTELGANGRDFAAANLLIEHAGPRLVEALEQAMVGA
jgi:glycosyltransferase involved in cell wall biosynthesis